MCIRPEVARDTLKDLEGLIATEAEVGLEVGHQVAVASAELLNVVADPRDLFRQLFVGAGDHPEERFNVPQVHRNGRREHELLLPDPHCSGLPAIVQLRHLGEALPDTATGQPLLGGEDHFGLMGVRVPEGIKLPVQGAGHDSVVGIR
jgi:hypothetical protein